MPVKGAAHRFAATPLTVIRPNDGCNQAEISDRAQISAIDNKQQADSIREGPSKKTVRVNCDQAMCARMNVIHEIR